MTICPIAIAVGCAKCPAFKVCPAKGILGDQRKKHQSQKINLNKFRSLECNALWLLHFLGIKMPFNFQTTPTYLVV
jgi:hypothetical protein